ncbi:hypothetical protein K1F50_16850 [Muricauda oceani]|uniref:Uncharacterized protein n=1 Tax=Flagellimonas oceani TaxID=2698672 RepID=A0A6G7J5K5_9FLAO|nr:hypothetical protein [Allomuricauda oceani]MBW8244479.1 hypothetical protein [Allomuricauda oceani]QII45868.1 hypothetical protein GVT53_14685 [Allomuricauda oceani]
MNKVRIIGLLILLVGIVIRFVLKNDTLDFLSGLFVGLGIGLIIVGRIWGISAKK